MERLDKFLGNAGIASRKDIKKLLKLHNVRVNGLRITSSGTRVDPVHDVISLDGQVLLVKKHVYFLLHKPAGVLSTTSDTKGRATVIDSIDTTAKIFPVGRLDKNTTGLLLLTDDGVLTHQLIHPKYHVPKVYELLIRGKVSSSQLQSFRLGVLLSDGITLPARVEIVREDVGETVLEVTLIEGRNRQIRRMCEELRLDLVALKRMRFGALNLGELGEGAYRELSEEEIALLRAAVLK